MRGLAAMFALFAVLTLSACGGEEGPAEQAGEEVDEAVEEMDEAVEQAGDRVEEATD